MVHERLHYMQYSKYSTVLESGIIEVSLTLDRSIVLSLRVFVLAQKILLLPFQ